MSLCYLSKVRIVVIVSGTVLPIGVDNFDLDLNVFVLTLIIMICVGSTLSICVSLTVRFNLI